MSWLAELLAQLYRRNSSSTLSTKSRLDREADRIQLGCVLLLLVLAVALTWAIW